MSAKIWAPLLLVLLAFGIGTGSWLVMIGTPALDVQLGCALLGVGALAALRHGSRDPS